MSLLGSPHLKPPSSLIFMASGLAIYTALASFWIHFPCPVPIKLLGLFLSFCAVVWVCKIWWESHLKADDGSPSQVATSPVASLIKDDLQVFIVEHMQFAVLSVWSDLGFQLETKVWPKAFGEQLESSGEDFVKWLMQLTRMNLEEQNMVRFQLQHAFGMNRIQWDVCAMSLPREANLRNLNHSFIKMSYIPFFKDEVLEIVHIIIQDISEIKHREEVAQNQRKEMEKFFALLQVSDSLFELFMSETRKLFEEMKHDLKLLRDNKASSYQEVANRVFRAVHTIKANARLFKLNSIEEVATQVENFLEEIRSGTRIYTQQTLSEMTIQIVAISEEVYSYASLRKEILNTADRTTGYNVKYRVQWIRSLMNQFASILRDPKFEQRHLQLIQKEFSRALSSFDKASLREYIRGYNSMVHDVAVQLGKEVDDLETEIDFHSFESATLARINDILLHCMRNAIDHGIERPEDRVRLGKPRKGHIKLRTREEDGVIKIEITDDGRGIDLDRLKTKAVELGFLKAEEADALTDSEATSLLFRPGVSTAAITTEISGRGLGMDAVRDYVQGLNGQLKINFVKGQSTTIAVWIPELSEELITPLAIVDLRDVMRDTKAEFEQQYKRRIDLKANETEFIPIFSDRSSLSEVLRMLLQEMQLRLPADVAMEIHIEELLGRRRVDSYNFFRVRIGSSTLVGLPPQLDEERGRNLENAVQIIRRNGGSVMMRGPLLFELNIPSNMPVRFNHYDFRVLIMTERGAMLQDQMANFFSKVMGGWKYVAHQSPFSAELLSSLENVPCVVLIDGGMMKTYLEIRSETDRKKDGIVLFPEEGIDIDALNNSSILPENILFVPPDFDERHFHRSLAGVIFRRFLKEMVREETTEAVVAVEEAS